MADDSDDRDAMTDKEEKALHGVTGPKRTRPAQREPLDLHEHVQLYISSGIEEIVYHSQERLKLVQLRNHRIKDQPKRMNNFIMHRDSIRASVSHFTLV